MALILLLISGCELVRNLPSGKNVHQTTLISLDWTNAAHSTTLRPNSAEHYCKRKQSNNILRRCPDYQFAMRIDARVPIAVSSRSIQFQAVPVSAAV